MPQYRTKKEMPQLRIKEKGMPQGRIKEKVDIPRQSKRKAACFKSVKTQV